MIFIGAEYWALAFLYAVDGKWGLALTFFAYGLANLGLYLEARV